MSKNNTNVQIDTPFVEDTINTVSLPEPKVDQTYDELMITHKTKSNLIRFLSSQGKSRSDISKFMNIRYQHVRNVLTTPLKKS